MRLPSLPSLPVIDHLNSTYFDGVWNTPQDHGRANVALMPVSTYLQTGAVAIDLSVVGLPTTDAVYVVYKAPISFFSRYIQFTEFAWMSDADVFTQFGITLFCHGTTGRKIPYGETAFYFDSLKNIVIIAINRIYATKCIGQTYPALYISLYKDTSRATPIVAQTLTVTTTNAASVTSAISYAHTTFPYGTSIYVNGWLYDPSYVPSLNAGDIVEIISDPDIVGYCDLYIDDNQTGYFSTRFGEYREVLHIPKLLNPNNYVITHDTLDLGVFDSTTHKGVYGHRIDPHTIESVTHNDFSMSRSVLTAHQNDLGAQGVYVRIWVRFATSPKKLTDEAHHISDLYSLTDTEIKLQLAGLSTHQINEWKAAALEQSTYLPLLYQFNGFSSSNILQQYVQAMGYFSVASTLSQAMHHTVYNGALLTITKPRRLVGYDCDGVVYINGRKAPLSSYRITNASAWTITLGFTATSYIPIGARVSVYVTEAGGFTPVSFSPTAEVPSITVPGDDYGLVKVVSYSTPQSVWGTPLSLGYEQIAVSTADYHVVVNTDGSATYTVMPMHYGQTMYLVPFYGLTTLSYPIDTFLSTSSPVIIPLTMQDTTGVTLPLLGYGTLDVYINGYKLIEDIDYTCEPLYGQFSDILQTLLVVSNQDYINLVTPGNTLEVVIMGDQVVSHDAGYVISNQMHRNLPPMVWSESAGRAFAHGMLVDVNESGNTATCTTTQSDGVPYSIDWLIPYSVTKLLTQQSPSSDISLRTRIDRALDLVAPTYPTTVMISHLYALYSPYLARIITDVATGVLTIVDEPKDDAFLNQFSHYAVLYSRDPVIGGANSLIDRRFVSLAAHYVNLVAHDATQMIQVQRLINLLLIYPSPVINEVLV